MLTPKTLQEALQDPTTKYDSTHDSYFDPIRDQWLESACSDPTCEYCVGRPQRPSLVVRKQRSET